MNEFTTTARVTFDALDVPVGYGVSVSEARTLIESGLNTLSALKEKHAEARERFWEKQRQKDEVEEAERKALNDRRDEVARDIKTLQGYGTRWFSDDFIESNRIEALEKENSDIWNKLCNMRHRGYGGAMSAGYEASFDEYKLKEIQKLLDIVAVETIPVDKEQAMMLSNIKSGYFEKNHSANYQSNYPVA